MGAQYCCALEGIDACFPVARPALDRQPMEDQPRYSSCGASRDTPPARSIPPGPDGNEYRQVAVSLRRLFKKSERLSSLPDTQTVVEAGFPDFETLAWWGIFAPTGTPPDIVAGMAKSVREILSKPTVAAQLRDTQQISSRLG